MERSEINALIGDAIQFCNWRGFLLPPFAFWSPDQWATKGRACDEIRDCMLGWDLTDFGSGAFHRVGLIMFTIRNGRAGDERYSKPYCEKMLIVEEEQVTPMHFHWNKAEDIINRGGGNLVVQVYDATADDGLDETDVTLTTDGVRRVVKAGDTVLLAPGESIFLPSRLYHKFWGEKGAGKLLLGEVSKVNDDTTDNRFHEPIGRFPEIEEDEPPRYLLFSEYPSAS